MSISKDYLVHVHLSLDRSLVQKLNEEKKKSHTNASQIMRDAFDWYLINNVAYEGNPVIVSQSVHVSLKPKHRDFLSSLKVGMRGATAGYALQVLLQSYGGNYPIKVQQELEGAQFIGNPRQLVQHKLKQYHKRKQNKSSLEFIEFSRMLLYR